MVGKQSGIPFVQGLGLELDSNDIAGLLSSNCNNVINGEPRGDVGDAARRGMTMLSRAMHANNDTQKFIAAMALFEYLGTGDEYSKFEIVRQRLAPHLVDRGSELKYIEVRFKELTSLKRDGQDIGLRHQIVHEGAFLEEILPNNNDRTALFRELQQYAGKVISDMSFNANFGWPELQKWRQQRSDELYRQ